MKDNNTKNKNEINGVKILKKGVRSTSGEYVPCWFSVGGRFTKDAAGNQVLGTAAVIYGKRYKNLPSELSPKNDSDMMTDYFENDRAVFWEGTPEFDLIKSLIAA